MNLPIAIPHPTPKNREVFWGVQTSELREGRNNISGMKPPIAISQKKRKHNSFRKKFPGPAPDLGLQAASPCTKPPNSQLSWAQEGAQGPARGAQEGPASSTAGESMEVVGESPRGKARPGSQCS